MCGPCASARALPPQEEKFKFYHSQLTHLVREYDTILGRVQPTIKPLLRPHLDDMERKIAPGFAVLTWTSLNIDGYLHRFKQVHAAAAPGAYRGVPHCTQAACRRDCAACSEQPGARKPPPPMEFEA